MIDKSQRKYRALVALQGTEFYAEIPGFNPADFVWQFEPDFLLSRLSRVMHRVDWLDWIRHELRGRTASGLSPAYVREMMEALAADPTGFEPILVAFVGKRVVLGDGYHRVGLAHLLKIKRLPAIVGYSLSVL